jgi:hypothetical protein
VNVDFPLHRDQGWAARLAMLLHPTGTVLLVLEAPVAATAERFAGEAAAAMEAEGFAARILAEGKLAAVLARRR